MNEQLDQLLAILMLPLVCVLAIVLIVCYMVYIAWELLVFVIKTISRHENKG